MGRKGRGEMRAGFGVGKPEGSRACGRQTYRWENSIKANLTEIRCVGVYWIHGCCEDGNAHSGSMNCGEFIDLLRNS